MISLLCIEAGASFLTILEDHTRFLYFETFAELHLAVRTAVVKIQSDSKCKLSLD